MHLHLIAPLSLDLRLLNVCVQFTRLHKGLVIDLLVELTIDKVNVSTLDHLACESTKQNVTFHLYISGSTSNMKEPEFKIL